MTEVGSKCQNASKKRMKKEIQEVAASLAGANEISMDAAVVALSLKKNPKRTLKDFYWWENVLLLSSPQLCFKCHCMS